MLHWYVNCLAIFMFALLSFDSVNDSSSMKRVLLNRNKLSVIEWREKEEKGGHIFVMVSFYHIGNPIWTSFLLLSFYARESLTFIITMCPLFDLSISQS